MKQKVVIRVSMGDHKKCRSKAMKTAVSVSGVESVALQGPKKDQMLVIGEIDVIMLARLLRKYVGYSEIMSVGSVRRGVSQVACKLLYPCLRSRVQIMGVRGKFFLCL